VNHTFNNLKSLMTKLDKQLSDPKTMLICDSYDSIVSGSDTESPELNLVEFINSLPCRHAVVYNRDLITEVGYRFLRETKAQSSCVFSVEKNAAGYSKDVHGQLNIS
jgi:hypothetical protein